MDIVDLDHVAIRVSDLGQAIEFYHGLLGLPIRDRDRYENDEVPYVAVVAGGRHIHLVPTDDPIDVGREHICLLVRSSTVDERNELEELIDQLQASGVKIEQDEPYKRYGAYGRGWAVYIRDPDNRRVELKIH